ncbi:MAG: ferredoxin [Firmicutes bacterium]|nr:ferredoxin [Bacillota bacterium]
MKVAVDPELCIECGLCIDTCPDVFDWDGNGKAHAKVDPVPAAQESSAREAIEGCPTEAIKEV